MAKIDITCPDCGKKINRSYNTPTGTAGMSGLSCSPCRIHFDIRIDRNTQQYEVTNIRRN